MTSPGDLSGRSPPEGSRPGGSSGSTSVSRSGDRHSPGKRPLDSGRSHLDVPRPSRTGSRREDDRSSSTPAPRPSSPIASSSRAERIDSGLWAGTKGNRSKSSLVDSGESISEEEVLGFPPKKDYVSPEHVKASASSAVEQVEEPPVSEGARSAF